MSILKETEGQEEILVATENLVFLECSCCDKVWYMLKEDYEKEMNDRLEVEKERIIERCKEQDKHRFST
ncbi:MAG: hypothetical protein PXY39_02920 [archaeon]|nr:hypothetical protein [archaeon]